MEQGNVLGRLDYQLRIPRDKEDPQVGKELPGGTSKLDAVQTWHSEVSDHEVHWETSPEEFEGRLARSRSEYLKSCGLEYADCQASERSLVVNH